MFLHNLLNVLVEKKWGPVHHLLQGAHEFYQQSSLSDG
jgi:hypothetical protein